MIVREDLEACCGSLCICVCLFRRNEVERYVSNAAICWRILIRPIETGRICKRSPLQVPCGRCDTFKSCSRTATWVILTSSCCVYRVYRPKNISICLQANMKIIVKDKHKRQIVLHDLPKRRLHHIPLM